MGLMMTLAPAAIDGSNYFYLLLLLLLYYYHHHHYHAYHPYYDNKITPH